MKISVYNKKGESTKEIELPKEIFDVDINSNLLYSVVTSQMSNRRQNSAHTKNRAEKRGGGRKPWRQKGTGRARHGSIRSPLWKGGGVTFGPRNERNYKKKINKKEKKKALFMTLTGKKEAETLIVMEDFQINKPKTKELAFLEKLPCNGETVLVAAPKVDQNLLYAARNISNVEVIEARNLTALDILSFKYLLILENSLKVIKESL